MPQNQCEMKKLLIFAILSFCCGIASYAQDKETDLKKLFGLMNSDKVIDGVVQNMLPALKQQASMQLSGEGSKEKLDEYFNFLMNEVSALSKKLVDEKMVALYDEHFTHEEIKDMIAFYGSPTGQKMLEKTPLLSQAIMNAMMVEYLPGFQARLTKKLEELKQN